jgi:hypothetical protein
MTPGGIFNGFQGAPGSNWSIGLPHQAKADLWADDA